MHLISITYSFIISNFLPLPSAYFRIASHSSSRLLICLSALLIVFSISTSLSLWPILPFKILKNFKICFYNKAGTFKFPASLFHFLSFFLSSCFSLFFYYSFKVKIFIIYFFYISQNKYFLKWCSFLECSIYFPFLLQNFSEVLFIPLLELKRQDICVIFKHTNNK